MHRSPMMGIMLDKDWVAALLQFILHCNQQLHTIGVVYAPVGSSAVIHHIYGYIIGTECPELEGIYINIYIHTHTQPRTGTGACTII